MKVRVPGSISDFFSWFGMIDIEIDLDIKWNLVTQYNSTHSNYIFIT